MDSMTRRLAVAALTLGVIGAGFAGLHGKPHVSPFGDFHAWHRVNPKPFAVSPAASALCFAPTRCVSPVGVTRTDKVAIDVYVNAAGAGAMTSGGGFPVGSVIVKEKLLGDPGRAALSTVMIKHAKGFNPKCGDWEFATLDADGARVTARGKLANCMACHERQPSLDYTFKTYMPRKD